MTIAGPFPSPPPADLQRMIALEEAGRLRNRVAELQSELAWHSEALSAAARRIAELQDTIRAMRGTDLPVGRATRRRHAREIAAKERADARRSAAAPKSEATS